MQLLPKRTDFYRLFRDQASHIHRAANLLFDAAQAGPAALAQAAPEILVIEDEADKIIQEISNRLHKTFITPLDPEDIHRLAHALDDVIDGIEEAAHHMALCKLESVPGPAVEMCRKIRDCTDSIQTALGQLEEGGFAKQHSARINLLEHEGDQLYRRALADLFESATDPIALFKTKEIYERLETTLDWCEDVADLLENVAVKNG